MKRDLGQGWGRGGIDASRGCHAAVTEMAHDPNATYEAHRRGNRHIKIPEFVDLV
ncbi:MAG: hypothetical protein AAF197_11370 [Pseudomonadota bacterium]